MMGNADDDESGEILNICLKSAGINGNYLIIQINNTNKTKNVNTCFLTAQTCGFTPSFFGYELSLFLKKNLKNILKALYFYM
jgi:hypothetical protein